MKSTFRSNLVLLGISALILAGPAHADELYGNDLPKKYPAVVKAYRAILPEKFKKIGWLYKLDGVSDPVLHQTIGGADFLSAWVCKPHDCGGNGVALLARPDASRVVAKTILNGQNNDQGQYFGTPSADEKTVLDARLQ